MRSSSLPLLLGCAAVLALPSAASALDFSPVLQPAQFDPLPIDGTDLAVSPVVPVSISGDSANVELALPFGVYFLREYIQWINITTNGVVEMLAAPGTNTGYHGGNDPIPDTGTPNGVIAWYWDDNVCPAGSINHQTFGPFGARTFVLEFNGCYRWNVTTSTTQAQIWLTEGSPIVRVYYGAGPVGGSWNATVGIENRAGTEGYYGLDCHNNCAGADFPANTLIQYGRSPIPDLQTHGRGLQITSLVKGTQEMTATLELNLQNAGLQEATGVTWDYYRSTDAILDGTDLLFANCRHTPAENIPDADSPGAVITRVDTCTFPVPDPGAYRICALLDPDDVVLESMEGNNFICSSEFVLGADLIGSVSIPETGGLGSDTTINVRLENRGSDPTGTFAYEVFWRDCDGSNYAARIPVHTGTLALAGGQSEEIEIPVYLDSSLDLNQPCAELVIDGANAVAELVEDNNTFTTCEEPYLTCMELSFPDLYVNKVSVDLPHGCFFGDMAIVEAEICNSGAVDAKGFGVRFSIDKDTVPYYDEPEIHSYPQSCSDKDEDGNPYPDGGDSQCIDMGGGQPRCIGGLCRAPCAGNSNADCGGTGLVCLEDPAWVVDGVRQNSCQLALGADQCITLRATGQIPAIDHRPLPPRTFEDGVYYFGVTADYTFKVGEGGAKGNNYNHTQYPGTACWTRKADPEPLELQFVDSVGAGETFPVFRRIHNHGVAGAVFPYRYVLSSNTGASASDIILEIVGHGTLADDVIEPFADLLAFDTVRIPANLRGGTYYLGLVIDPNDVLPELREDNNTLIWCDPQPDGTCLPHPVTVIESSLRVVTPSLPAATVGQSYQVQLRAVGGNGSYTWSLASGELPPGLSISPDGLISGFVLEEGYFVFQVEVTSGESSSTATFVIRSSPAASPLTITTLSLPPAYLQQAVPYSVELGASGGTPPYTWICTGLPNWLRLNNNVLSGTPIAAAASTQLNCTVTDQVGQSLSATYTLVVQQPSGLEIYTPRLEEGELGLPYEATVTADGGSTQYDWDFDDATLPPGIREVEAGNVGALEGVPEACGTFLVRVTVTDLATGATDTAELPLTVVCYGPSLAGNTDAKIPPAERNRDYPGFQLEAEGAVHFAVVGGALPEGLTLSETGYISGKVTADARYGAHNVAVELTDSYGGKGLDAFTIVVVPPAPPEPEMVEKVDEGCSSSGESSPAGLLPFAALFALLGLRRFRRSAGIAAVAAAAVLVPAAASAQAMADYGMVTRDITYQRLQGATAALSGTNIDTAASSAITLPFRFRFFGEEYERVVIDVNGVLHFTATSSYNGNAGIPATAAPNNFIAPWWDDLEANSGEDVRYLVRGVAPNREFVVEWLGRWWQDEGNAPFEMQVSLYENNTFAIRWGDPGAGLENGSVSATVGVEDATGSSRSMAVLPCSLSSPYCKKADWVANLQNKEVSFITFANLKIGATSTAAEGNAGIEQTFNVTVLNQGPKPVPETSVEIRISEDLVFSDDDFLVGTVPDIAVPGNSSVTVGVTMALPRALEPGLYYVLARVDPDNEVEEFIETDNTGGSFRFQVMTPMPDLAVESISAPTSGTAGSRIAVVLDVANLGNLDANNVPYRIVLSDNEGISAQDPAIHVGQVSVGWMQTTELTVLVEIPAEGVPVGTYYLGAVLDPDNVVEELNELNNLGVANQQFHVTAEDLRIVTTLPAELHVGAPYCIPLVAEGGDGVVTWSVAEGTLPPGLDLNPGGPEDPLGASLCGQATRVGVYEFVLRAESGGMTAEAEYSLEVTTIATRLTIASSVLPIANFNRTYEAGLVANGGLPPYTWDIADGDLPLGLVLGRDGLVYGIPGEDGSFSFQARVTDDANRQEVKEIHLQVVGQGRIECATRSLGTLMVGEDVALKLRAGGGLAPYTWEAQSVQRYGVSGSGWEGELRAPPGLELAPTGDVIGKPKQIGHYLWTVEVTDDRHAAPDTCMISLEVIAGQALTITTTRLPLALADYDYSVKLEAAGGSPGYKWRTRNLPSGLALDEATGVLSGKLTLSDLQGQPSRTFAFLVEVEDSAGTTGQAPLSVTLTEKQDLGKLHIRTETTTGCSTAAGGASLLALGLVALGLRRRR